MVPKHAFIAWMVVFNRLPTKDRMNKWGIELECCCSLCKQVEESRDHFVFLNVPSQKRFGSKFSVCVV